MALGDAKGCEREEGEGPVPPRVAAAAAVNSENRIGLRQTLRECEMAQQSSKILSTLDRGCEEIGGWLC